MRIDSRRLDAIREDRSELENHYIDELVGGRVGRREFLRIIVLFGSVVRSFLLCRFGDLGG